jgi:hypothetical protein
MISVLGWGETCVIQSSVKKNVGRAWCYNSTIIKCVLRVFGSETKRCRNDCRRARHDDYDQDDDNDDDYDDNDDAVGRSVGSRKKKYVTDRPRRNRMYPYTDVFVTTREAVSGAASALRSMG